MRYRVLVIGGPSGHDYQAREIVANNPVAASLTAIRLFQCRHDYVEYVSTCDATTGEHLFRYDFTEGK